MKSYFFAALAIIVSASIPAFAQQQAAPAPAAPAAVAATPVPMTQQNLTIVAYSRPTKTSDKSLWASIGGSITIRYGTQTDKTYTLPADGSGVTVPLNLGTEDLSVYTINANDSDGNQLLYCNDGQAYMLEEFELVNKLSSATLQIVRTVDGSMIPLAQTTDVVQPGSLMTAGGCDAFAHPDHTPFVHPAIKISVSYGRPAQQQ